MPTLLITTMLSLFLTANIESPAKDLFDSQFSAVVNEETGLTDYTILGRTFSLDVEHTYDLND